MAEVIDEVRLRDDVERGARGGPRFATQIIALSSGVEQRNALWDRTRGLWDIGYGIQDTATFQEVVAFFYARRGRLRGFRFKDWSDFQANAQIIGTGDGVQTEFQLSKTYTSGGISYTRPIQKPVAGTVSVSVNGIADATAAVDTTTGVVTPTSTPAMGESVVATFEFDVPVRFDTDEIAVELDVFNAGAVPNLPLTELRIPLATLS